jgi:hypothetical protein
MVCTQYRRPIKKSEVHMSLLEYGIEKEKFQTWDTIEHMVLESPDEIKMVLYQSGEMKKKNRRRTLGDIF